MAERRMFTLKVVGSDAFLGCPASAQALYFQLCMRADDDGFLNNGSQVLKSVGAKPKDLKTLIDRRFVLSFDGILVIKHWRMANSLKNDRTRMPAYPSVAAQIYLKPNKSYTDHPVEGCMTLLEHKAMVCKKSGIQMESNRNPNGTPLESVWNARRTEQKGTEQKGTEQKGTECNAADSGFQKFWDAYPKQWGRDEAIAAWYDVADKADEIMAGLDAWKASKEWAEENGRYIPKPANFLSDRRWASPPGASGRVLDEDEQEAVQRMMETTEDWL